MPTPTVGDPPVIPPAPAPALWDAITDAHATTWDTWVGLAGDYSTVGHVVSTTDTMAQAIANAANTEFKSNGVERTIFDTPEMVAVITDFAASGSNVIYSSGGVSVVMVTAADGTRNAEIVYNK